MKSPEAVTASEQIETNRTLRALLEDNQARELRKLRKEIASQKILLGKKKKRKGVYQQTIRLYKPPFQEKGFWCVSSLSK